MEELSTENQYIKKAKAYINRIPPYPKSCKNRGIIICGGGDKYFPLAWVCIKMLRRLKCNLPIQLWYLGRRELSVRMEKMVSQLRVECIDAHEVRKRHPCRVLNGYELKPFSLVHSRFKEILLLDADNVPVINPERLFDIVQYKKCGAVFWPRPNNGPPPEAWEVFNVPYLTESAFETGQILVNKAKVWRALCLALWYNEHSDFYYKYVDGEKETFHLAFRKIKTSFAMVSTPPKVVDGAVYQHDYNGEMIFQHRQTDKWKLYGQNRKVKDFIREEKCLQYLEELRRRLSPRRQRGKSPNEGKILLRCPIDGFTGYGLHAQQIIRDFGALGWRPRVLPIRVDEPSAVPISQNIKRHFVDYSNHEWELLLHPPGVSPTEGKKTIFFTMWESTRLSQCHLENLKKANVLIVPCEWNASIFSAQGIDVPIELSPLGIDENVFYVREKASSNHCVFGAAGNSHISGRTRKGLDDVIKAFQIAFPSEKDVLLKIKTLPNSQVVGFNDRRIQVYKGYLTQNQLAEWYSSLTCFVSAAKAEAWGLMQHQAMAVGRPVIACYYGGLREFFDPSVGYCVDYSLESADERYSGLGIWAQPSLDSLVEQMRRVYNNMGEAAHIGLLASKRAHQFTWRKSNQRLLSIVRKYIS